MHHPLLTLAISAARKAGDIIVRALDRLETVKVTHKNANRDLVSEIDQRAEQEIIYLVRKSYPQHAILAEESGEQPGKADYCWIIDPLDGTTNFVHGLPHFAVSIAVEYKGRIEHGVIYDPVRQELFTASRGQGARLNQYRMRVSACTQLSNALLGSGFPGKHPEHLPAYLRGLGNFAQQAFGLRRSGSAALDLAYVASGRLAGFWEYDLAKWDIAAGALLVSEAGGVLAEPDGGKDYLNSGNVVAANPALLKQMLQVLQENQM